MAIIGSCAEVGSVRHADNTSSTAAGLPHLVAQPGYVGSTVVRYLLRTIAPRWSEVHDRPNPHELILRVYAYGVLVAFAEWRFTNVFREGLGLLPDAPLPRCRSTHQDEFASPVSLGKIDGSTAKACSSPWLAPEPTN